MSKLRVGSSNEVIVPEHNVEEVPPGSKLRRSSLNDVNSVLEVNTASERDELPLWKQGNADLATEEMMDARHALRSEPQVVEVLEAFWNVELKNAALGHTVDSADHGAVLVSRAGFFALYERAYRVLLEEWDPSDAAESIAEDWAHDAGGAPGLRREAFEDSLFELADVWTEGLSALEYATFLWRLLRNVCDPTTGGWSALDSLQVTECAARRREAAALGALSARSGWLAAGSSTSLCWSYDSPTSPPAQPRSGSGAVPLTL